MVSCELCGKEGNLVHAFIEGVRFIVCSNCGKHGKVVGEVSVESNKSGIDNKKIGVKKVKHKEEFVDIVVNNAGEVIRKSRENKGLTHKELAAKLNEKESVIPKIEQGSLKMNLDLARKFERFFNVKLVIKEKVEEGLSVKSNSNVLTIGDFVKK